MRLEKLGENIPVSLSAQSTELILVLTQILQGYEEKIANEQEERQMAQAYRKDLEDELDEAYKQIRAYEEKNGISNRLGEP